MVSQFFVGLCSLFADFGATVNVVIEQGRRVSRRGQPAIELGVNTGGGFTVGLHFEHTSVSGIVLDLKRNAQLRRVRELPAGSTPNPAKEEMKSVIITTMKLLGSAGKA